MITKLIGTRCIRVERNIHGCVERRGTMLGTIKSTYSVKGRKSLFAEVRWTSGAASRHPISQLGIVGI